LSGPGAEEEIMATTATLKGSVRTVTGKGVARKLRRDRRIPGVLYGRGRDPVLLDLDEREFVKLVSDHSASNLIVDLTVSDGSDVIKTLIREVQVDPVSGSVLHVDLNQISLTEQIEVEVPIELEGIPEGVKNAGGILQHTVRTVALRCFPHNMPDKIEVDVSHLEIGDAIRVADLDLKDVELLAEPDTTLASVVPPAKVEEAVPAEEEVAAEAEEPELVGKKGEEEEEAATESKES
jgi:large subunit ribosomal protein L25